MLTLILSNPLGTVRYLIPTHLDDYEKYYAIIGKRIENKDFMDCLLFDLNDFDKYL
jgi:hypothetical protein